MSALKYPIEMSFVEWKKKSDSNKSEIRNNFRFWDGSVVNALGRDYCFGSFQYHKYSSEVLEKEKHKIIDGLKTAFRST